MDRTVAGLFIVALSLDQGLVCLAESNCVRRMGGNREAGREEPADRERERDGECEPPCLSLPARQIKNGLMVFQRAIKEAEVLLGKHS